jgi:long-chain acyl-CoA synthetase
MEVDPVAATIPQVLRQAAQRRPRAVACRHRTPDGAWVATTWGQLWQEVQRLAAGFSARGIGRGDRLAILARTCREWHLAEMAALLAGAAVVGIEAHSTPEQIAFLLEDSGASALVLDGPQTLARVSPQLHGAFKFIGAIDPVPAGQRPPNLVPWPNLAAPPGAEPASTEPGPHDLATLLYTAGTTGKPKGIEYDHAQILAGCRAILDAFPEFVEGQKALCWLPMAHLFQRMMNVVGVSCGWTTYFVEDPRQVLECLRTVEPSVLTAVPRFYEKLHEEIRERLGRLTGWRRRLVPAALAAGDEKARHERAGRPVPWGLRLKHALLDRLVVRQARRVVGRDMKVLITGSAPLAPWLLEFFHSVGLLVLEAYGLSENTVPMAVNRFAAYRFGSVGRPLPANEVRFAEDGEILVKSSGLFRGYFKESPGHGPFTADGFYPTGDQGRLDEDGFLYLVGRKSEILKTSTGRRISPVRVEAAYRRSPYLDHVVVFGEGRKHLVALVTFNPATVARALAEMGLSAPGPEEMARLPAVQELVRREMQTAGEALSPHEQVRAFAVLSAPLSVVAGELTPTLKLRRDRIAARHADLLEQLYHDSSPFTLAAGAATGGQESGA